MNSDTKIEAGRLGRLAVIRLRPNQDLVGGVEAACRENGISRAVVRSAVGSLVDASLLYGEAARRQVPGPGVEILTLSGTVSPNARGEPNADLRGTISDSNAAVFGGRFEPGENAICITLELVLQEWLPA